MKALDYDGLDHVVDKIYDLINSGGSADYIVEEGTSGIWTYRKWASGVMEAYGRESRSTAMTNKIQEYSYYGNQSFTISALGFTDIKSIQVTGQGSGHYFGSKVESFNTTTILVSSRASSTVTSTIDYMIDIKGLWKEFTPSVMKQGSAVTPWNFTIGGGTTLLLNNAIEVKNGFAMGTLGIQVAATRNTWTNVGTTTHKPEAQVQFPVYSLAYGRWTGLLSIDTSGTVKIYPFDNTLNTESVGSIIAYRIA